MPGCGHPVQHSVESAPTSEGEALPAYYARVFAEFEQSGLKPTWNWVALLFGILWYFYRGLWVKGLLMLTATFIFLAVPAPLFWLYAGIFGNYDYYYLLKRKKKHLW